MKIQRSGKNFFGIRWIDIDGEMYINKEDVINNLLDYNKGAKKLFNKDK